MKNYADYYHKITKTFQNNHSATRRLNKLNHLLTKIMYIAYPIMLLYLFYQKDDKLMKFSMIPFISFLLVSLIRKIINAPRPYESYNITPLIPKSTTGKSMPSRHVFSATIISVALLHVNIGLGILGLLLSITLAICRVIGGVHYPRDVIVGFIVGIICGMPLFLL